MALGVNNEELWSVIHLMWFVVLKAREMQVLKPTIYDGPIRQDDDDDADLDGTGKDLEKEIKYIKHVSDKDKEAVIVKKEEGDVDVDDLVKQISKLHVANA